MAGLLAGGTNSRQLRRSVFPVRREVRHTNGAAAAGALCRLTGPGCAASRPDGRELRCVSFAADDRERVGMRQLLWEEHCDVLD